MGKVLLGVILGTCLTIGIVVWLDKQGLNDNCGNPTMGVSCGPSATTARPAVTTTTKVPPTSTLRTTTTTNPTTTVAPPLPPSVTRTSEPPLVAPTGPPARPVTVTTTTTTVLPPLPAGPEKLGILESKGHIERCEQGGMMVFVDRYFPPTNGITYTVKSRGSNGSPELVISGVSDYKYPDIRVVTTESDMETAGYKGPVAHPIPIGPVNVAYDISTPGKTLRGVVICL